MQISYFLHQWCHLHLYSTPDHCDSLLSGVNFEVMSTLLILHGGNDHRTSKPGSKGLFTLHGTALSKITTQSFKNNSCYKISKETGQKRPLHLHWNSYGLFKLHGNGTWTGNGSGTTVDNVFFFSTSGKGN